MKILLAILMLAGVSMAQVKNSYGYQKWALIGTTKVLVDTTGRTTWKDVGTADTGKAFPFSASTGDYILSWTHGSNGDDSGAFALRWLCKDSRVGAWIDTAQYVAASSFTVTKSVAIPKDTLPGMYQAKMYYCDSLKPVIKGAAGTNASDTMFIRKLNFRSIQFDRDQVK
jgi:hypothetical protein